ncbi:hypothetical protein FQN60_000074, partial [Etheostoma spectabile]
MILPVKSLWCKKPHHQDQLRALPPEQCFGLQAHVLCMFVFRKFCRINKMMELMPYAIHLMVSHRCVRPPPSQVSLCPFSSHCCLRPPPSQVSCETSSQPLLTLFSQPQEILTLHDEPSLPPSSAQESIIILDEQDETIQEATTVQDANSAIAEAADSLSIIGALRHVSSLQEKDPCTVSCRLLRQWKIGDCPG